MKSTIRVVTWNCRRATAASGVWNYLLGLAPDVALLQEVSEIPKRVRGQFASAESNAVGKNGHHQRFNTTMMVKGRIGDELRFTSCPAWVQTELERFSGNLLARDLILGNGELLKAVSVYSPAWPAVERSRLAGLDVTGVRLSQNPDVWVADLLRAGLVRADLGSENSWVVAGDFNLSETFDARRVRPRGNREFLDRMAAIGFVECLRQFNGRLTPTFRNAGDGAVKHQIDHMFVTKGFAKRLITCRTGAPEDIFTASLSDHLPIVADFAPNGATTTA